jgi:hypothetical protein
VKKTAFFVVHLLANRGKPLPATPTEKETKRREREVTIMVVYNGGGGLSKPEQVLRQQNNT